jgi:hypothetical protein
MKMHADMGGSLSSGQASSVPFGRVVGCGSGVWVAAGGARALQADMPAVIASSGVSAPFVLACAATTLAAALAIGLRGRFTRPA